MEIDEIDRLIEVRGHTEDGVGGGTYCGWYGWCVQNGATVRLLIKVVQAKTG